MANKKPFNRVEPGPGQESVWDYPRPPRLEKSSDHIEVVFGGRVLAETQEAYRVLETSHPPVYYLPMKDVDEGMLEAVSGQTYCEFKGPATYYDVVTENKRARRAAWTYPRPTQPFRALVDHLAVYPTAMDACYVNGEQVQPQEGDFYGGWITSRVVGPFKGAPGTLGW
jgi:uncharacterized protein (DUF427 family)